MPPTFTLNRLPCGAPAVVCFLSTQGAMRRRLMDIGLTPGCCVEALFKSCSGDPVAYRIQGAVIALRETDAATIHIRECAPEP